MAALCKVTAKGLSTKNIDSLINYEQNESYRKEVFFSRTSMLNFKSDKLLVSINTAAEKNLQLAIKQNKKEKKANYISKLTVNRLF